MSARNEGENCEALAPLSNFNNIAATQHKGFEKMTERSSRELNFRVVHSVRIISQILQPYSLLIKERSTLRTWKL
jgi:hypothetical protein